MSEVINTINMSEVVSEAKETIVIFTDAGSKDDVDDEAGILDFVRSTEYDHTKYNVEIVIGGAGNKTKLIKFFENQIDFEELKNITIHQYEKEGNKNVYPSLNKTFAPEYIVVISPKIDDLYDVISLDKVKSVGFMGNKSSSSEFNQINLNCMYDPTFGLNDGGSDKFHAFLIETQTPVFTLTSKECREPQNMFSEELFVSPTLFGGKGLPPGIVQLIRQCVFKNVGGRLDPNIINPSNTFLITAAIGLINPEIKGANYSDAKGIADLLDVEISLDDVHVITKACQEYMDLLNSKSQEFLGKPIDKETFTKTLNYLVELEVNVAKIFGQIPVVNGKLITSNEGDLHTKYPAGFDNFVKIGKYSPAFDLFTINKFMKHIKNY